MFSVLSIVCYKVCQVMWGLCVGVLGGFCLWVRYPVCSAWLYECGNDGQVHTFEVKMYIPVVFKLLVWCGAEGYVSGWQDAALLTLICAVYGLGDWRPVEKEGSGHCSGISLPAWWRDWMWNCSKGSNMLLCWRGLSKVIDSANMPHSCWLCKICWG